MLRKPAVEGRFYPGKKELILRDLKSFMDPSVKKQKCLGAVVPHAGYIYSGSVAGAVYSQIEPSNTYILLGPNHTGYGKSFAIMRQGAWQTILGEVPIDYELAEILLEKSSYLEDDHLAHHFEHSLEVQLPFLQYFGNPFKIVPISISQYDVLGYKELGKEIGECLKSLGRDAVILASSDMTHYENHESAKKKDKEAIEAILKLDEDKLFERIRTLNISMCGYAPTISMLVATKILGAKEATLVKYQTSGDVSGDYSHVVGYAGIIVR
jgi:hypothetical protein